MAAPSQMYTHTLNPLKGWPRDSGLDFIGTLSAAVTCLDPYPAGRCVHVRSITAAAYGPGTSGGLPVFGTGVKGTQMGIFLLQGSGDFDVSNPGGTDFYAVAPKGVMSGLVATGAYELETTEYNTALTYTVNEPLRAIADDTTVSSTVDGGRLTNASVTVGTTAYVGVVSRGTYTNAYGKSVLAFWPVYAPGSEGYTN